jgi:hypothetical protein
VKKKLLLLMGLICIVAACSKKQTEEKTVFDHVVRTPTIAPQKILHKTLTVQKQAAYTFEVPAHCIAPRLRGNFKSYRYEDKGSRISDEGAAIDLLLLDEQQYNEFMRGPSEATTRVVHAAYEQEVDWALPSTFDTTRKFYMVFQNSDEKSKTKIVDTDFTLSFE